MRPVEKLNLKDDQGNPKEYSPYGSAKDDLMENIGPYCSFCGRKGYASALDVEHIQPKKYKENGVYIYAHLAKRWDNFLIGCKNCNPIKGNKNVTFDRFPMPDRDNTFLLFDYNHGSVKVKEGLSDTDKQKAENMISLVGLDRRPGHPNYSPKDKRWKERLEQWDKAERYAAKYSEGRIDLEDLCDIISSNGYWSVWMTAFEGVSDVRIALIRAFSGTSTTCFDSNGNAIARA